MCSSNTDDNRNINAIHVFDLSQDRLECDDYHYFCEADQFATMYTNNGDASNTQQQWFFSKFGELDGELSCTQPGEELVLKEDHFVALGESFISFTCLGTNWQPIDYVCGVLHTVKLFEINNFDFNNVFKDAGEELYLKIADNDDNQTPESLLQLENVCIKRNLNFDSPLSFAGDRTFTSVDVCPRGTLRLFGTTTVDGQEVVDRTSFIEIQGLYDDPTGESSSSRRKRATWGSDQSKWPEWKKKKWASQQQRDNSQRSINSDVTTVDAFVQTFKASNSDDNEFLNGDDGLADLAKQDWTIQEAFMVQYIYVHTSGDISKFQIIIAKDASGEITKVFHNYVENGFGDPVEAGIKVKLGATTSQISESCSLDLDYETVDGNGVGLIVTDVSDRLPVSAGCNEQINLCTAEGTSLEATFGVAPPSIYTYYYKTSNGDDLGEQQAYLSCADGYQLIPVSSQSSNFGVTLPEKLEITCAYDPDYYQFLFGAPTHSCELNKEYVECSQEIIDANNFDCQNGICKTNGYDLICECFQGWTYITGQSRVCSQDLNECDPNNNQNYVDKCSEFSTCLNINIANDFGGQNYGYTCDCDPEHINPENWATDFAGYDDISEPPTYFLNGPCRESINDCVNDEGKNPCGQIEGDSGNEIELGTCTDLVRTAYDQKAYRCDCINDYVFKYGRCTLLNPCDSEPCGNGQCSWNGHDYHECTCPTGYSAANTITDGEGNVHNQDCSIFNNPCDNDPCKNGSTCQYNSVTFTQSCDCLPGFEGRFCQTESPVYIFSRYTLPLTSPCLDTITVDDVTLGGDQNKELHKKVMEPFLQKSFNNEKIYYEKSICHDDPIIGSNDKKIYQEAIYAFWGN